MTPARISQSLRGLAALPLIVILLVVAVGSGGWYLYTQNKTENGEGTKKDSLFKKLQPKTPYDELVAAIDKTNTAKTQYIEYHMDVSTHVSSAQTGLTQTVEATADGYITGSTDGETSKAELRIGSPENPSTTIVITIIEDADGNVYTKTAATGGKWLKMTKEEAEADDTPTDASLYGFYFLDSLFSKKKLLFNTVREETVEALPDEEKDGKTFKKYTVEISMVDYINALQQDEDATARLREDSKIILRDAVLSATFTVDTTTNYITKLMLTSKNLTHLPNPEAEALGITSTHDIDVTADLSRFDVPTGIIPPPEEDLLNPTSGA